MRFTSVWTSAPRLPSAMVTSAITANVIAAELGSMKAALNRNAKAAAFVPVAIRAVTGVGLPS